MIRRFIPVACLAILIAGCASQATKDVNAVSTGSSAKNAAASYTGLKRKVAIARFSNETTYAKGPLPSRFYQPHNVLQHRKGF